LSEEDVATPHEGNPLNAEHKPKDDPASKTKIRKVMSIEDNEMQRK